MSGLRSLGEIFNCGEELNDALEFHCPKKWATLERTDDSRVRHCNQCNQTVTLCTTASEFVELGNKGQCVALRPSKSPIGLQERCFMGRPSPDAVRRLAQHHSQVVAFWTNVLDQNPEFASDEMEIIRKKLADLRASDEESRITDEAFRERTSQLAAQGVEAYYLHFRQIARRMLSLAGGEHAWADDRDVIYKTMLLHFDLTREEFEVFADETDQRIP